LAIGSAPTFARAQDTTRGVRVTLRYASGTKPGVLVLPILGVGGDSARTIIQRDLDYGDRVQIIGLVDSGIATAGVNYALIDKLGAAALVQAFLGSNSLHVIVHDVAGRRVLQVRDFPLAGTVNSADWRLAIHGVSDIVEQWVTGQRGIAQTRVAFVRDGQIYITDSDGADTRAVTPRASDPLSPAWHPSGRYLTYSVFTPRGTQIVTQDLGAGTTRALTATPTGLNITPLFSPDGNQIAYAHGEENGTDLFLAPAFSNDPGRRITVGHGTDNTQPTFSPDGRRIAFTSGRSGHPEVYITDVDGTNPELLTPYEFGDDYYRASPDWSPDGRVIVYQSRVSGQFQIMTISLRDRGIKQLTSDGINEDPSWAPDSRHVVFTSNRSGVRQLWVLDTESSRTRQLTFGGAARLSAWSRALGTP
jgi:TolB protein